MITVVMPAYNAEDFIKPAVDSILNQTYKDFELIIVDDGSTDKTLEIARAYETQDDRVRVICKNNGGPAEAMNTGLKEARYPWVAVMHSDDIALPDRFARQMQAVEANPDVVIWGTNGYHINSKGDRLSVFKVGPTTIEEYNEMRNGEVIPQVIHPTALLNREIALKVGGYDKRMHVCEDIELFDRMMVYGPLLAIDEPLTEYRIHGSSLSMTKFLDQTALAKYVIKRQQLRRETGKELELEAFMDDYKKRPLHKRFFNYIGELSRMHYRYAGMAYGERRMLKVFYHFGLATLLRPGYPIRRAWVQVLAPRMKRALGGSTSS